VTDSAQDLYVDGLLLNSVKWNTFSTSVDKNGNSDCYAVLTVPEDYVSTGNQQGTLVFWASDGR
jgi:hypothetical protein